MADSSFMDKLRKATKDQLVATSKRNDPKPVSNKNPFRHRDAGTSKRASVSGPGRNKMPIGVEEGGSDTKLTVRMSPKKKSALEALALAQNVSAGYLTRLAIDALLEKEGYEG